MIHFREVGGTICLYDGDRMLRGLREVAIAYCASPDALDERGKPSLTLLKYGERSDVEAWASEAGAKYRSAGFDWMADSIRVLVSPHENAWTADLLNKVLHTTGAVRLLVDWARTIDVVAAPVA